MPYLEKPWLKRYDPQIKAEYEVKDISLVDHFRTIFDTVPTSPAMRFLGVTVSYRELDEYSNQVANALIDNGCEPGDVVGLNMANIPQYLIAQIGVMKAGCVGSGVSPLLTPREMAHQLKDSGAKALFTLDPIFEHRFKGVAENLPDLKFVVGAGLLDFLPKMKQTLAKLLKKVPTGKLSSLPGKKVMSFKELLAFYPKTEPKIEVGPDHDCLLQYTGGTTGLPKGAIMTHRNITIELEIVVSWLQMREGKETILSGFPYFHIAGLALGLGAVYQGHSQIVIPDPRNTDHIIKEMAKLRPTILVNVPSLYMMLLEQPAFRKLDFSDLQFCLSAASPFPAEAIRELESVVGENKLIEAYGMTEVSSLSTCNPRLGKKKIGSVGLPLPNVDMRLMDLETGTKDVPVGEEGEIVVKGPQVMRGYFNKPNETATALREHDGETWLHTGDVARMDEDGYYTIIDRSKDMLNVGGFKVFSREVEEKLYEHPAIELCAIVGEPNPSRPGTDIVKLVFQPSEDHKQKSHESLKKEIMEFARANFAPYKAPKKIEVRDSLPLTPIGKVDKKALR
jgi:acyl-CoA synthetase (AMP-forming)/AMP-acid ligase II